MQRSLTTLLQIRRAALKAEWSRRLWAEPQSSPMASPDVLAHLMDETLDELGRLLHVRPTARWFTLHTTHLEPLHTVCPCGLNPLLAYFSTGGEALKEILAASSHLSERERNRVQKAWHFIAQSEIEALCGLCHNICAPPLSFPVVLSHDFAHETIPSKPSTVVRLRHSGSHV